MLKVSTFSAQNELGYVAVPLFGPADGEFEKNASASLLPPVLQYIEGLRPQTNSQYVLVNAMAAGEYFGCFPAGTLIETAEGEKPIEEIEPGDEVLTHMNRYRRVRARSVRDTSVLCDLYVQGLPSTAPALSATSNHELRSVLRDDFIRTKRRIIWKGDTDAPVEYRRERAIAELDFSWIPISLLRPGDYITEPFPLEEDSEALGDEKWNCPEVAFLMGLYAAEGCIAYRYDRDDDRPASVIYVVSGHEESTVQEARRCAEVLEHGLQDYPSESGTSIRLQLCFAEFSRLCVEHIGTPSTEKKLSDALLRMPHEWQRVFFDAYSAGDGCVRGLGKEEGTIRCVSASAQLLRSVRLLLARLGLVASISGRHNKKASWYNGNPIFELSVSGGQLRGRGTPKSYLHPDGFILSAVKKVISYGWQGEVYDLTVEGDRSFIASGVAVHNSNINGDHFPEAALIHAPPGWSGNPLTDKVLAKSWPYGFPTFYNAHPFAHHRNKDPSRAYGQVELALWNDQMKRVELVVRVDYDKCCNFGGVPVWDKLKEGQFPDVSMGSKVPFDTSSITLDWKLYKEAHTTFNAKRHKHPGLAVLEFHRKLKAKNGVGIPGLSITRDDYDDYCKKAMNRILPDGRKVFVYNDYPRFFDISFVFIGADRTAKVMVYIARAGQMEGAEPSAKVASDLGYSDVDTELLKSAGVFTDAKGNTYETWEGAKKWEEDLLAAGKDPAVARAERDAELRSTNPEMFLPPGQKKKARTPFGFLLNKKAEFDFVEALKTGAEKKEGEIKKDHVPSNLTSKAVPLLTKSEPDIPEDLMKLLSSVTGDQALSTTAGLGMVMKPREFQRMSLMRGGCSHLADTLDQKGILFPKTESEGSEVELSPDKFMPGLARKLLPLFGMRSALGPAIERRIIIISEGPKKEEKVASSHPAEVLRKIGAAYNAYRTQLMDIVPSAQDLIEKTASVDGELKKIASVSAEEAFTPLSYQYLSDAYLDEVPFA